MVTLTKDPRCFLGNYSDRSVDPRVRGGKIKAAGNARNPNGTRGGTAKVLFLAIVRIVDAGYTRRH